MPTAKRLKIGLFGGSFNPPTIAHLALAQHAYNELQLDQVWWLIAPHNPDKPKHTLASFMDRHAMCELIAQDYSWLIVSDLEARLGTQQTADTLKGILSQHPDHDFIWLMGTDNMPHFHTWDNWQDIINTVPVAIFTRPGDMDPAEQPFVQAIGMPQPTELAANLMPGQWSLLRNTEMAISATQVREAVRHDQPCDAIVPAVADYIREYKLYRL